MKPTLAAELAGLRERPSASLALDVLRRVGIVDAWATADSPLGPVGVAFNRHGISFVSRISGPDDFEERFVDHFGRPLEPAPLPAAVGRALESGRSRGLRFDLRPLTRFERAVLVKTGEIPRGETRSYTWVAGEIGHDRAVRAVGTALARNPIPLLIPCHRVVRGDGHIGNYGMGGPEAKRAILRHEGLDPEELESLATRGVRLLGCRTTQTACLPSCRNARRIRLADRLPLPGPDAARAAGMRPCQSCRPFR